MTNWGEVDLRQRTSGKAGLFTLLLAAWTRAGLRLANRLDVAIAEGRFARSRSPRAAKHQVAYLPGLAMRRIASLTPAAPKPDTRDAFIITDALPLHACARPTSATRLWPSWRC